MTTDLVAQPFRAAHDVAEPFRAAHDVAQPFRAAHDVAQPFRAAHDVAEPFRAAHDVAEPFRAAHDVAQPFRAAHDVAQPSRAASRCRSAALRCCSALFLVLAASLAYAQGPADTDLAKLEQTLTAHPDDLRAGNDYRMAIIKAGQYDRGLDFFKQLVTQHPTAANARLNYGFQYVDKIPAAGSITQVILANNALTEFTKALELKPTWIGYYTRGNSYLFWPKIFGRTKLGIADLEAALKIQNSEPKRKYHVRTYLALGDGYFKNDEFAKATATWKEGLAQFPDDTSLKQRLGLKQEDVKTLLDGVYDPNKRVDTNLQDLWAGK